MLCRVFAISKNLKSWKNFSQFAATYDVGNGMHIFFKWAIPALFFFIFVF